MASISPAERLRRELESTLDRIDFLADAVEGGLELAPEALSRGYAGSARRSARLGGRRPRCRYRYIV